RPICIFVKKIIRRPIVTLKTKTQPCFWRLKSKVMRHCWMTKILSGTLDSKVVRHFRRCSNICCIWSI
ncbi:hypothetical protein GIB67_024136, partial [Kingdonia uniflora]